MSNRRSILLVLPCWAPTFRNKNIGKLIVRAIEKNLLVLVYCCPSRAGSDFKAAFPDALLLDSRPSPAVRGIYGWWQQICGISRILVQYSPDLILWSYIGYRENLCFWIASKCFGIPYILKCDSSIGAGNLIRGYVTERLPAESAALLLSETYTHLALAQKVFPCARLLYFPNGVPVSYLDSNISEIKAIPVKIRGRYLLYTGRILYEKGIDLLVESFYGVADQYTECSLVLVGEVSDIKYFEQVRSRIQELGLASRIHLVSVAFGVELYSWYYHAEAYVLASRQEGLPNVLTEAMYFGLPVIATRVGQVPMLIDESCAILVSPGDTTALSNAMRNIFSDKELRERLGCNARNRCRTEFNDDVHFLRLWNQIAKSTSSADCY